MTHYKTNDEMLICELGKAKLSVAAIAEKFGILKSEVRKILVNERIVTRGTAAKVVQKYMEEGFSREQILSMTDLGDSYVRHIASMMCLVKRRLKPDGSIEQRYAMASHLVQSGMVISEACKSVKLSTRDYYLQRNKND